MKTIIKNRLDFIKNNNIIVKYSNTDEALDILSILGAWQPDIIFAVYVVSDGYIISTKKNIIVSHDYNKWKKSKMLIHEFPTKNFINSFLGE